MTVTAALVRLNEASATRSSAISAEILSHSYPHLSALSWNYMGVSSA
jgi:hypothetical protein